jgi:hypothetical protein
VDVKVKLGVDGPRPSRRLGMLVKTVMPPISSDMARERGSAMPGCLVGWDDSDLIKERFHSKS